MAEEKAQQKPQLKTLLDELIEKLRPLYEQYKQLRRQVIDLTVKVNNLFYQIGSTINEYYPKLIKEYGGDRKRFLMAIAFALEKDQKLIPEVISMLDKTVTTANAIDQETYMEKVEKAAIKVPEKTVSPPQPKPSWICVSCEQKFSSDDKKYALVPLCQECYNNLIALLKKNTQNLT
jgi:predicted nuclease with TOPRIM domain